jgi:diguanylate cyclase (GGDEF)-like protein/PAS domain S-box-containing protein
VTTTTGSDEAERKSRLAMPNISPNMLGYLIAPPAFVLIYVLDHFREVAHEPWWLWLIVLVAGPTTSALTEFLYNRDPSRGRFQLRIAQNAAVVTTIIYLTGWGPVFVLAYAFAALENISWGGSRAWKISALWSVLGIAAGQIAIGFHVAPSKFSIGTAHAVAIVGAFLVFFVIRMAGAVMEQKEEAESSMRLSEDRFRSLIQNSSDVTTVVNGEGVFTYVSPSVHGLLGYEPSELLGKRATDFVHDDDRDRVTRRFLDSGGEPTDSVFLQYQMEMDGGMYRHVEALVTDLRDRPSVGGFVCNVRDISERKAFEAILAHRALHDSLTGLANRQLTLDRTEQMLSRARRRGDSVALCFIDLDNFKDTNDSFGHEAGDKLLQAVAKRLDHALRSSDTVGRLGGDEFVILAECPSIASGPSLIAERIRKALDDPFFVEGFESFPITVTASIGIATGDRQSAPDLLRDADVALYQAKAAGKNCCVVFEAEMQSAVVDRLEVTSALYLALERKQFFLLYQPIFDLASMQIRGVEALIRWLHPTRGVLSPDQFIPTLEDTGLIVKVGQWVLQEACQQAADWAQLGYSPTMSVNVSMRQLETDDVVIHVHDALEASNLDPGRLTVEITESALMHDVAATVARLQQLKNIGVMVAIDDFGTGQSSLSYLRHLPIDHLKIDRSFVSAMDGSRSSTALIHTLVELSKELGLTTVAEGIESALQLEGLRSEHCDLGQGFYFSHPLDSVSVKEMFSARGVVSATTLCT